MLQIFNIHDGVESIYGYINDSMLMLCEINCLETSHMLHNQHKMMVYININVVN